MAAIFYIQSNARFINIIDSGERNIVSLNDINIILEVVKFTKIFIAPVNN